MLEVKFYDRVTDCQLKFAVIISRSNEKWVLCKHKERTTYEFPGGHRENGESIIDTAKRELYEETGALDYGVISENSMYAMPEAAIPSIESIEEEAVSAESSNSIFIPASVDIGPMSVYYIKDLGINANSAKNITSPTGNAYNLIKGKTFDFDLTWYPRNAVKVGLYDTATGEVQNIKTIKDGSGQGSIKVPYDGKFYFYIWNTGDSYITVNGSIDA